MRQTRPRQGEVHLWSLNLDGNEEARFCLLSDSEQARAERFHFEQDKRRWITGRSLLRVILGRCLGAAPETLSFETGPWGKPGLSGCPLRFNLSHSGGAALLALAWHQEVGVDMEAACRDLSAEELAPQVLSVRENAWLREQVPEQRSRAFLTLWTAKEAYVKATGQGLSFPLTRLTLLPIDGTDQFHVSALVPVCPIFVCQVDAGPDYLAALALEGAPANCVRCFDFRL